MTIIGDGAFFGKLITKLSVPDTVEKNTIIVVIIAPNTSRKILIINPLFNKFGDGDYL